MQIDYNLIFDIDKLAYNLYLTKFKGSKNNTLQYETYIYVNKYRSSYNEQYIKTVIIDNYVLAEKIIRRYKLNKLSNVNR